MSQSVKEFVRQSGVDVRSPDSASNSNNNFARELEMEMERADRARTERMTREASLARGQQFMRPLSRPQRTQLPPPGPPPRSRFAQYENNSPLENEFADLNIDKLVNSALKEPINTSEFENMNPINEFTDNLEISPLKPGMFNATINRPFFKTISTNANMF